MHRDHPAVAGRIAEREEQAPGPVPEREREREPEVPGKSAEGRKREPENSQARVPERSVGSPGQEPVPDRPDGPAGRIAPACREAATS